LKIRFLELTECAELLLRPEAVKRSRSATTHDALTELPNRLLFIDRLKQAERNTKHFAVMVLDLDQFKLINNSLGHGAGDHLLIEVAPRLTTAVPQNRYRRSRRRQ
jgi:diguanylate cyclase (GGDEF)-like protein